ncbi:MAG: hypothetical protein OEV85_07215 [Candidatus Thorarchaeota archaeon]|nr:hypothetical protein [Candidatus Thorarchaeota archaeon]
MIDDDFESVFRRVFESLLGSLGTLPEGSTSYSYFTGSMMDEDDNEFNQEKEPDFERIDLEDEVLFLVKTGYEDTSHSVKIDARTMTITFDGTRKSIKIDLDFDVDIEKSSVSSRNGVMEISLKMASKGNSGAKEGYLRIN